MGDNRFSLQVCSSCNFLGHYKDHDLYFCMGETTIIQRYGEEDYEYSSGLVFALTPNPRDVVRECMVRALLVPVFRKQITEYVKRYMNNERVEFLRERLAEANERLLLDSYNDRDLPLLISSLVYESNKKIYNQRIRGLRR